MKLISQSEFAKLAGVTRQAVRDAYIRGKLRKINKKIDLDCELSQAYLEQTRPKSTKKNREKSYKVSGGRVVEESLGSEFDDLDNENFEVEDVGADTGAIIAVEQMTRRQAERQKLVEQILQMQVKTAKERKELVSCESVAKVFAKLAAVDTSEFHPLADKIAGDVAALCGLEDNETRVKIKALISKSVFRALKHRKRLMDDFLTKMR